MSILGRTEHLSGHHSERSSAATAALRILVALVSTFAFGLAVGVGPAAAASASKCGSLTSGGEHFNHIRAHGLSCKQARTICKEEPDSGLPQGWKAKGSGRKITYYKGRESITFEK